MAGRAAAASGVGTAAGAAATGDVDPAFEMLTDGGGEEGDEGEELILKLQKNRLATAGVGKRLLIVAEMQRRTAMISDYDIITTNPGAAAAAARSRSFGCGRLLIRSPKGLHKRNTTGCLLK